MKVIYLFKFNNSEQILSVDVPDNATIDEINAIIFQNNNEWIAREYKSEWEILPHGENPHSAESLAFAQLLAKIACKIDKIESGMRDGLKELNNMLAEANCLSEYPSIPTEYKEDLQSLVSFPAILKSALVQCRHKQSDYPTKGREYIHKNKDKLTLTDLNFIEYYLKFELIRNLDNLFIDYVNSNSLLNDVIIKSYAINRNINKKYTYKQARNILLKIKHNDVLFMERKYDFTELEKNYNNRKLIMGSLIVEKEVIVTKTYYCCCKCYCHNPNH